MRCFEWEWLLRMKGFYLEITRVDKRLFVEFLVTHDGHTQAFGTGEGKVLKCWARMTLRQRRILEVNMDRYGYAYTKHVPLRRRTGSFNPGEREIGEALFYKHFPNLKYGKSNFK